VNPGFGVDGRVLDIDRQFEGDDIVVCDRLFILKRLCSHLSDLRVRLILDMKFRHEGSIDTDAFQKLQHSSQVIKL